LNWSNSLNKRGWITPLTNWALEAAFSQCDAWLEAGIEHALSINLSAVDLCDLKRVDRIHGLFQLGRSGLN
jgi:diguanylate cyclase